MSANRIRWGVKIFALVVLAVAAVGVAVMGLWNWLAPELFGLRPVTFVQAIGLLVLCRLLVGGWRGRAGGHLHWRARLAERLEKMTPEEREKFRAGMQAGCGWRSARGGSSEGHGAET